MATIGIEVRAKNLRVGDIIDLGDPNRSDVTAFRFTVTQAPRTDRDGTLFVRAIPVGGSEETSIPFWRSSMMVKVIARRNK